MPDKKTQCSDVNMLPLSSKRLRDSKAERPG